ncbi:MAG: NTP transferase domain-containing protein [Alcanivorax sp.]|uniref:NTP transferase domain-containing protein n=1 Tax=Alloalcanivorax marinus TaxID=1177169 RepID=UPI00195B6B35|nr:NTP transferase domain-containing protein [Alloalcanivorax marinus]
MKTLALIAAAGRARRFGSDKRRAPLADGRALLTATRARAGERFADVRVILRADDRPADLAVPETAVIVSPRADQGLGLSLADAFAALLAHDEPAEVVAVWLGDMPWVATETVDRLLAEAAGDRIVRPTLDHRPGFPVLFGRHLWPALAANEQPDGARALVARHRRALVEIPVTDPGVLRDVDRPDDLNPDKTTV